MLYISPVLFLFVITMIFHKSTGLPHCTQPIKDRGLTEMEKDDILQLHTLVSRIAAHVLQFFFRKFCPYFRSIRDYAFNNFQKNF